MSAPFGYTAMGLVLAGCAAYAASSPVRSEVAPLEQWEREELITILRGWKHPAPPERSRT